jgi:MtrB/PioB family decaheme-associated outer membrane protein
MHMHRRLLAALAAIVMLPAGARAQDAQTSQAPQTATGTTDDHLPNYVDFGGRYTWYGAGSDQARYQRYNDLGNGVTLDALRFTRDNDMRRVSLQADRVGYLDQRFLASLNEYGKLKVSFEWNQIPLFYSQDTSTIFTTASPGVLRINDAIQTSVQNNPATLTPLVAAQAQPFDMRTKRNIADFRLTYAATDNLDLSIFVRNTQKNGSQPWAGTFGFSDAVELPVPVDTRTTDLGAALEWGSRRGSARLGYDGSFFHNNIGTLTWDNPLRITDSPTAGPMQGRMSLWPNSDTNTASASGLLNLPARSRVTAALSVGSWSQNDPLIPFTINTSLPVISLDRQTAAAKAHVTAMTYSFNSRPTDRISFTARYNSYDFDNRTPVFHVANTVAYDTTVEAFTEGGTSPYSYMRRTFDADVSVTPMKYVALRAGYTREQIDQTFRTFDTTTEDTERVSADATGLNWLTLRTVYEHAKRVGSGLDEQTLDDIGEQVSLRQFDISDRTSDRVSALAQVTPVSQLAFNGSVSAGQEDRPGAVFGLRSNDNHSYSAGLDFVPREAVSFGMNYTYEKYTALQNSREANPGAQFNDPTRDWTTTGNDTAQTFTASLDLLKLWPRTDVRVGYDYSHAESLYVYGLGPNTTLPPVVQLPAVVNQLQRGMLNVRYRVTTHLAAGFVYSYNKYSVNDFASGAQTLTSLTQPSFLMLGYIDRPYTANTASIRFTYFW